MAEIKLVGIERGFPAPPACRYPRHGHQKGILHEAERELEAATMRTAVNATAKKLQKSKAELKALETSRAGGRSGGLAVAGRRRSVSQDDLVGYPTEVLGP